MGGTQTSPFLMKSEQTIPLMFLHSWQMKIVPPFLLTAGVKTSPSEACNYRHNRKGKIHLALRKTLIPKPLLKSTTSVRALLSMERAPVQGFWMMDCVASSGRVEGLQDSVLRIQKKPQHPVRGEESMKTGNQCWIWDPENQAGILLPKSFYERSWDSQVTLVQN